ncbi:MAG: dihydroorotase family protein [Spirochaetia bacterium]|jgi:dihydroorotase|nr:dihydroorotase family protein [Spirochaetia bacterium]
MVDPHVHLRDWNQKDKETLVHGLSVAYACGIDEVFDMPNTDPPLVSRDALLDRLSDAQAAIKDLGKEISYHVWAGLQADHDQIVQMAYAVMELFPLVVGLKLFAGNSTGGMGIIKEKDQRMVFATLAEVGYEGVLAVHCEKEALLDMARFNPQDLSSQSIARPAQAEIDSVSDMLRLAAETGFRGTLHICHISTAKALSLVAEAKEKGMHVTCGATTHHALLTSCDASSLSYARMNPPLRSAEDRNEIFEGLLDGRIDWIESDHAPHTLKDKQRGAAGIPGFSGTLLLLKALWEHGCSRKRLMDLTGRNVYAAFGLDAEDVDFTLPDRKKLSLWSMEAAKAYPYDGFISLRSDYNPI